MGLKFGGKGLFYDRGIIFPRPTLVFIFAVRGDASSYGIFGGSDILAFLNFLCNFEYFSRFIFFRLFDVISECTC